MQDNAYFFNIWSGRMHSWFVNAILIMFVPRASTLFWLFDTLKIWTNGTQWLNSLIKSSFCMRFRYFAVIFTFHEQQPWLGCQPNDKSLAICITTSTYTLLRYPKAFFTLVKSWIILIRTNFKYQGHTTTERVAYWHTHLAVKMWPTRDQLCDSVPSSFMLFTFHSFIRVI